MAIIRGYTRTAVTGGGAIHFALPTAAGSGGELGLPDTYSSA
jgi:hypothetical protein